MIFFSQYLLFYLIVHEVQKKKKKKKKEKVAMRALVLVSPIQVFWTSRQAKSVEVVLTERGRAAHPSVNSAFFSRPVLLQNYDCLVGENSYPGRYPSFYDQARSTLKILQHEDDICFGTRIINEIPRNYKQADTKTRWRLSRHS